MKSIDELINSIKKQVKILESRQVLSKDAVLHLREIYKIAWLETKYDAYNEKSQETAHLIWPHIKALDEELKFQAD